MNKRAETGRGGEGDAVRVLPPDPDPRRDQAPPSPPVALVVAAVVSVLGFVGFMISTANDSVDGTAPPGTVAAPEIAASEPVEPGRTIDLTSAWAAGAGIAGVGEVTDAVVGQERLVAAGAGASRAAVWATVDGSTWETASVEAPSGSTSRFEVIARGSNGWIGAGTVEGEPAVWRAEEWESWELLEPQPDLSEVAAIVDLTVGPGQQFWLVGSDAAGPMLWTSLDGLRWSKRDPRFEPTEIHVNAAVATEDDGGWLYLAGARCRNAVCRPALWRTQDGSTWADAETPAGLPGGELTEDSGAVTSISIAENRIVAAGSTGTGPFDVPAVWVSLDGVTWTASGEGTFGSTGVNVRLQRVSDGEPAVASLTVGVRQVDATAGDTLATELGEVALLSVNRLRATLRFGDEEFELGTGASVVLRVSRGIESVAVQADRIVAVGFESDRSGSDSIPVAWTSADGGSNWDMHRLPGPADLPAFAGLYGRRLMAVSSGGESWHHNWDGRAAAAAARGVVTRLMASVVAGNLAEVIAALPATSSVLARDLEFPGLPEIDLRWWDESSGRLDTSAVSGALAFVTELDTAVYLFDCSATPLWRDRGRVRVDCGFRISSDLLRAMGIAEEAGTLGALVEEGAVVSLTGAGTPGLWRELEQWAREADPEGASLVFGGGFAEASLPIDATYAQAARGWADSYRDAYLLPGESIEVATPVGMINWSLIDPFGGQVVDRVVVAHGAFWALADDIDRDAGSGDLMLWRSEGGMVWEAVSELPRGAFWRLVAVADRLFAFGAGSETPLVSEWNETGWTELEIATAGGGNWWLHSIAESNGRLLILGDGWDVRGDRPLGGALWVQAPGGSLEVLAIDGPDITTQAPRSLIGIESGFVLIASLDDWSTSATGVWGSTDGTSWELLTDEPGFAARWLRWLGTVDGELVVVAWGEDDCAVIGEPCRTVWQHWRSVDGTDWNLVGEMNFDGVVAGGPLGLVAIGPQSSPPGAPQPMSVLMTDGRGQFVEPADAGVQLPGAEWASPGEIAMSGAAIVVPINRGFEDGFGGIDEETEASWLLVGRVLGP